MSKETIRMNQVRLMRIGIKEVLSMAEQASNSYRHTITENWDKEGDKESRRALNKAHRGLVKSRKVVRECQSQLRALKQELKKLNSLHDFHVKALSEAK